MGKQKDKAQSDPRGVVEGNRNLVLFNDDHNTFEHVITTLISVCGHDPLQAEQCAMVTHFIGKCVISKGAWDELKVKHDALASLDLTVEIV